MRHLRGNLGTLRLTGRTLEQSIHVLDRDADVSNGGDSAQDAPLDEAANGYRVNVQNLGRFG